jgi:hypothetical protein
VLVFPDVCLAWPEISSVTEDPARGHNPLKILPTSTTAASQIFQTAQSLNCQDRGGMLIAKLFLS